MKEICNGKINSSGMCEKCHQVSQTTSGYCTRLIDVADEPTGEVGEEIKHGIPFKCPECGKEIQYGLSDEGIKLFANSRLFKDETQSLIGTIEMIKEVMENIPELNMSNYSEDQVYELNNGMIEISQILDVLKYPSELPSREQIENEGFKQARELKIKGNAQRVAFFNGFAECAKWLKSQLKQGYPKEQLRDKLYGR